LGHRRRRLRFKPLAGDDASVANVDRERNLSAALALEGHPGPHRESDEPERLVGISGEKGTHGLLHRGVPAVPGGLTAPVPARGAVTPPELLVRDTDAALLGAWVAAVRRCPVLEGGCTAK
jgi:hypothetical protein